MSIGAHNDPTHEPVPDPAVAEWLTRGQAAAPAGAAADWSALERRLAAERGLGSLRSLATSSRIALVLAAAVGLVVAVLLGTPRADLAVLPTARMVADLILLGVPLVAVVAAFMHPVHRPPLSASIRGLAVLVVVFAMLASATLPAAHTAHPASLAGVGEDFVGRALSCFVFGVGVAAPMLVIVRLVGRTGAGLGRFHRPCWWPGLRRWWGRWGCTCTVR